MKTERIDDFYYSDDSIENVSTFEEARSVISQRLINLKKDLAAYSTAERSLFAELVRADEERNKSLMDLYAGYYSPCNVSDTEYSPKGQCEMSDIMIDFSNGYEKFVKSMEDEYVELMDKRRRAISLLRNMLSISYPYSRVMYHFYVLQEDPGMISEQLFISRATFYRLKSVALNILTSMYYHPDGKIKALPARKFRSAQAKKHSRKSGGAKTKKRKSG